uniref:DNA topoisomerase n=1 Tax=viral metagenome TaxID=1070528 RepID=A0A6C0EHP2_9ZZZZ
MSKLVIVESSAKCKTIQSYLGNDYIVKACMGHSVNIDTKLGLKAIDTDNNYKIKYKIIPEKKKYLTELIKLSKKCSEVIIASDSDKEGEAIGYHLIKELKLNIKSAKRIVFNEITKTAIQYAIQNPKSIDMDMVKSQQTRQALDFLIGFNISPLLWKYVKNKTSAGRCQSTALHLINTRNKSIKDSKNNLYCNLEGIFKYQKCVFDAKTNETYTKIEDAHIILEQFKNATFKIQSIKESISKNAPPAPYITTTIQQDASSYLNLPPKTTMSYLQKMYERGVITYMRTDSKVISDTFSKTIEAYILKTHDKKFYKNRLYKNNSKNVQEAHECIRPVDIELTELDSESVENKLYSLIWKRTVASQMQELQTKIHKILIENDKNKILFESNLEKPIFLGYKILYNHKTTDDSKTIDSVKKGAVVNYSIIKSNEKYNKSVLRYNEASLIKDLESKGIGRPSTYSNIIDTLFKREYIKKDSNNGEVKQLKIMALENGAILSSVKETIINKETNKIFISELGEIVDEFLHKHFDNVIGIDFTANLETHLDEISEGTKNNIDVIDMVYRTFIPKVNELSSPSSSDNKTTTWENNTIKKTLLGTDPITNKSVYVYKGKYGPVIQEGDDSIKYYSIPKSKNISTITLEECIELMAFPKVLEPYKDKPVEICYSSYGYYIHYDSKKISIKEDSINISEIDRNVIIELINKDGKKIIKTLSETIKIMDGPYGPYLMKINKKKNKIVAIPKNRLKDIDTLTIAECIKLLSK